MTKHTPTPWNVGGTMGDTTYLGAGEKSLGSVRSRTDAAHIVRCVNLHDELVATLELALECGDMGPTGIAGKAARAVLAKVNQ